MAILGHIQHLPVGALRADSASFLLRKKEDGVFFPQDFIPLFFYRWVYASIGGAMIMFFWGMAKKKGNPYGFP